MSRACFAPALFTKVRRSCARGLGIVIAALGCVACREPLPPGTPEDESSGTSSTTGGTDASTGLVAAAHLKRISIALRGFAPELGEMQTVAQDPTKLSALAAAYVSSAESRDFLADLHNEALLLRVAPVIFPLGFAAVDELAGQSVQALNTALIDAPFALIDDVVRQDLPYSTIVTADYVMANATVAAVWGLPYEGDGPSYKKVRFSDDRPHAGILGDPLFLTRHYTTYSNLNRGRANAVARALLCQDFLHRDVEIDSSVDFGDEQAVKNAIATHPACVACHQTLDPLAAYFAPLRPILVASTLTSYPQASYFPELAEVFAATKPGYFGFPGGNLTDLGRAIAEDPRFASCTVERTYAYLHQIDRQAIPPARRQALLDLFQERMSLRDLIVAIVTHQDFAQRSPGSHVPERYFYARPWQMAKATAKATGFRWQATLDFDLGWGTVGSVDLLKDSLFGFETLAGGIDSEQSALPSLLPTPSRLLVERELAARAALHVVEHDFATPLAALLLPHAANAEQSAYTLNHLCDQLFGASIDAAHRQAVTDLFSQSLAAVNGDRKRAFTHVVYTLLRDLERFAY